MRRKLLIFKSTSLVLLALTAHLAVAPTAKADAVTDLQRQVLLGLPGAVLRDGLGAIGRACSPLIAAANTCIYRKIFGFDGPRTSELAPSPEQADGRVKLAGLVTDDASSMRPVSNSSATSGAL